MKQQVQISNLLLFIKRHSVSIVFLLFGILVVIQHLSMGMYFDDFGYASLSYAKPNYDMSSQQFGLFNIFEYLSFHYSQWGGRILFFFVEIVLLRAGIEIFALFQGLVITGIFYLIYRIIMQNVNTIKNDWLVALLSITCYGTIGIMTFRDGIFWASASALYVIPIFFVLLFVYLYPVIDKKNTRQIVLLGVMPLLAFIASFSQEQVGAALFVFVVSYTALSFIATKKKPKVWQYLCITASALGLMALLLAPGNATRMSTSSSEFYGKGILERVSTAGLNVSDAIFGANNTIFIILLFIFSTYLALYSARTFKQNRLLKSISVVLFVIIVSILFFTLSTQRSLTNFTHNNLTYYSLMAIISVISLLLLVYYLIRHRKIQLITLLLSGLASQAVMLMAPYYPLRSFIFFLVVFFIISLSIVFATTTLPKHKLLLLILPLLFFSAYNYLSITIGYYSNNSVNKSNHQTLVSASKSLERGEKITEVSLSKLPNELYSQTMPYQDEYTLGLLRNYYKIPSSVRIIYK